ncbi:hypothetical protein A6U94_07590 [Agrobacterium tumefaciens]|nr:hypothetical protein A6U94_07590 [Agrobacterium tumefaciens]
MSTPHFSINLLFYRMFSRNVLAILCGKAKEKSINPVDFKKFPDAVKLGLIKPLKFIAIQFTFL